MTLGAVSGASHTFILPPYFDYGATLLWALSGALVAARRGYDIMGILTIALVSAAGGGLLRDGLFLNRGAPALVTSPVYLPLIAGAAVAVLLYGHRIQRLPRIERFIALIDALGLGAYAVVGVQKSLDAGITVAGVLLVGVLSATGGAVLRDVLMGREPALFQPDAPFALAALAGCVAYLLLGDALQLDATLSAWTAIALVFALRVLALRYGWRTGPARRYTEYGKERENSRARNDGSGPTS